MKILKDDHIYAKAAIKVINEITIYGVDVEPKAVLNRFAMIAPHQGIVETDWAYIASSREIHVINLHIPVDEGLFYGKEVALLEVIHHWANIVQILKECLINFIVLPVEIFKIKI